MTDFRRIATDLEILQNEDNDGIIVESTKRQLARTPERWLLTFDGADNSELAVEGYFPQGCYGMIIVTTLVERFRPLVKSDRFKVPLMSQDHLTKIFVEVLRLQRLDSDMQKELQILIRELGYHTLGVSLCASHMAKQPGPKNAKLVRRCCADLKSAKIAPNSLVEDIWRPWMLAIEDVKAQPIPASTDALELLQFFTLVRYDDITINILHAARQKMSARNQDTSAPKAAHFLNVLDERTGTRRLEAALQLLHPRALVSITDEEVFIISIHQLLHHCSRLYLLPDKSPEKRKMWLKACQTLADAISWDTNDTDIQ
jgi:hypothetical protein